MTTRMSEAAQERAADNRAYAARKLESEKVAATREQTAELRALREAIERLLDALPAASRPAADTGERT